ncbi:MAG: LysM peptidoglycan-binding domain-containing protein [Bacilli bacterium]|nr:LysM peptidoglycan-binding domain-containing protein [Bacilli bacterium]MDD4283025.1 LysM peptidoglycan-binding domain-containing protein [Bacilli bacterium]MDD4718558.1 LysM peptidoglycan-binding domain-containing protein [Bacilli bacterium]
MKKIIPFKKEIIFKTNLSEITSISLEHTLQVDKGNMVTGEFIVSGDYKMVDTSVNVESFSFNIPFEVSIDDKYIVDNVVVDIYDFYYEIINNNVLSLNIEVIIDRLEEKPLIEESEPIEEPKTEEDDKEEFDDRDTDEEDIEYSEKELPEDREGEPLLEENRQEEITNSLFDNFDSRSETYTTYKIYIVREGDTLDLLIQNYGISKEELAVYNNINELNIGDRLIIPTTAQTDEAN